MGLACTAMSRRSLLQAGLCALLPGAVHAGGRDSDRPAVFLSAATLDDDRHCLRAVSITESGLQTLFNHELPSRAHHVAVDPVSRRYMVVARRPGTWLASGSLDSSAAPVFISLPENRRTCGHGFFAGDGSRFWSVETTLADTDDDGLLVAWQVTDGHLQRGQEFSTAGTGPHEALLMPDGKTVVIANGGYRSDDEDRSILNLDTMRPSLVYLDSVSGRVVQKVELDNSLHKNSIRHLDVNGSGQVIFAMQFEGEPFLDVPLVGIHRQGEAEASFPEIPLMEQQQLNQYCGSVRFDESGRYAVVSAPRGNRMTFWDVSEGRFLQSLRSRDGCGVAAWKTGFVFTAGTGKVSWFDCRSGSTEQLSDESGQRLFWDNHLTRV